MTPTQGEHAQTEALRLADDLEASSLFPGNMRSCNNAAAAELRRLHAQVAALTAPPAQPAAPQCVAYAELDDAFESWLEDQDVDRLSDGYESWLNSVRSCWDSALRASHGQAPAGATSEPIAYLHDDGYWTPAKTADGRKLNDRLHFAGSPKIGVHLAPTAQAAPAAGDFTTLGAAMRAIQQAIELIGDPADDRMRAVKRVLRGAVIVAEDSGELAAPDAGAVAGPSDIDGILDALSRHDDPCEDVPDALRRVRTMVKELDRLSRAENAWIDRMAHLDSTATGEEK